MNINTMAELVRLHAQELLALGPVGSLAMDPCPRCMGRVIASDTRAACTNCGWRYDDREQQVAVGSRRADL